MDLLTYLLARQNTVKLVGGKIPKEVLPSYVDDVIEGYMQDGYFYEYDEETQTYKKLDHGEVGKIYVDENTSYSYRWTKLNQTYRQIGGPDYLNEKPDGTHFLINPDTGELNPAYKAKYQLKYGISTRPDDPDFNWSTNERVLEKLIDNDEDPFTNLTLQLWSKNASQTYEKRRTLPCIFAGANYYGFLDYYNPGVSQSSGSMIYVIKKGDTSSADHGYYSRLLYNNVFPNDEYVSNGTNNIPLTTQALAEWFYYFEDESSAAQAALTNQPNFLEYLKQILINFEVIELLNATEAQWVRDMSKAVPQAAIMGLTYDNKGRITGSRLSAQNQLVDELYIHDHFDWSDVTANS